MYLILCMSKYFYGRPWKEHHSNLVPWQLLAEKTGCSLKFGRLRPNGTLDMEHFEGLVTDRTKLVAMCHVSNVLGCVNPVGRVVDLCKKHGAKLLLDACQSAPGRLLTLLMLLVYAYMHRYRADSGRSS